MVVRAFATPSHLPPFRGGVREGSTSAAGHREQNRGHFTVDPKTGYTSFVWEDNRKQENTAARGKPSVDFLHCRIPLAIARKL